jgi:hypothetical protein
MILCVVDEDMLDKVGVCQDVADEWAKPEPHDIAIGPPTLQEEAHLAAPLEIMHAAEQRGTAGAGCESADRRSVSSLRARYSAHLAAASW